MQGKKINLADYKVTRTRANRDKPTGVEETEEDYGIKSVIANIMCHPSLEHKGYRFYTIAGLAKKIDKCEADFIVLDAADFDMLKKCFDDFKGFARNDAEMVARIYEAEEVELEEKGKEKKK